MLFSTREVLQTIHSDRKCTVLAGETKARPRILVIAYSCDPQGGSEGGVGWGLLRTVAEFANCVVLVSSLYGPMIGRWKACHRNESIEFVEIPEPKISRLLSCHRTVWFIYYLFWLRKAAMIGKQLHQESPFDVCFHATVTPYWLPSPTLDFGIPCVWGPAGGAVISHIRLWPILGLKGLFDELLDLSVVRTTSWLPATRRMWRHVTVALVNNEETLVRLPRHLQTRSLVLNHVLFLEPPQLASRQRKSHILYFSALETRKGPRLAIRALYYTPSNVKLRIAGDGPELHALKRLAYKLKLSHRVSFLCGLTRHQAHEQLAEAAAVIFTGMREEGGASLAEAMLAGSPVIVLANGGARTVAQLAIDPSRMALIQPSSVLITAQQMGAAMTRFSQNPPSRNDSNLDQAKARKALRSVFEDVLSLHLGACRT